MRQKIRLRHVMVAGVIAITLIIVAAWVLSNRTTLPGPASISAVELDGMAGGQARIDIDPHVVAAECPKRTYREGATVVCTAYLTLAHGERRVEAINVKLFRSDDGQFGAEVHRR
jgi:hypothetical protein